MMMTLQVEKEAGEAKARGMIYALLARAWAYPDDAAVATLCALAAQCSEPGISMWLPEEVRTQLARLREAMSRADGDELRGRYAELFSHAVRGACPLYEMEYGYGEIVQQAGELADIAGFYEAFGLHAGPEALERIDHVCVECEFMSVLCAKQAAGAASHSAALVDACFDGQRSFLRDHLAHWLPAFCARVGKSDDGGAYGAAAGLTSAFIECECRAFDVSAGPQFMELRPVDPDGEVELECGSAGNDQLVPLTIGGSVARR